ncbi:MAG: hypothetical protein ACYDAE_25300 [Steroidobacteraceae bacterium]
MFEAIHKRLNGNALEPASVSEALAKVLADRDSTRAHLEQLNQRRRQALLDDATDAVLDKVEREIDRATIQLEKLTLAEQPLRDQLEAARARATLEQRDRDRAEFAEAFEPLAQDAFALSQRAAGLVARAEGLHLDPAVRQGAIPLLSFLAAWIEERRPAVEAARVALGRETAKPPAPAVAPLRRAPPPERPAGSLQHGVRLGIADHHPAPQITPQADDTEPLAPGYVRVITIRGGFEDTAGVQHRAGHRFQLPATAAENAARNGAVEILEGGSNV